MALHLSVVDSGPSAVWLDSVKLVAAVMRRRAFDNAWSKITNGE